MRKTPWGWHSRCCENPSRDSRTTSQWDSPIWIQSIGVLRYINNFGTKFNNVNICEVWIRTPHQPHFSVVAGEWNWHLYVYVTCCESYDHKFAFDYLVKFVSCSHRPMNEFRKLYFPNNGIMFRLRRESNRSINWCCPWFLNCEFVYLGKLLWCERLVSFDKNGLLSHKILSPDMTKYFGRIRCITWYEKQFWMFWYYFYQGFYALEAVCNYISINSGDVVWAWQLCLSNMYYGREDKQLSSTTRWF